MKLQFLAIGGLCLLLATAARAADETNPPSPSASLIQQIFPPEQDFFDKELVFQGIPIKANRVVADAALLAACERLDKMLRHQPAAVSNLVAAGVELHIIGKDQVTTDLPEWRQDKGKPLAEYNGQTRDERTRGMGGKLVSCGEENLLQLKPDRYFGRDICVHEFAHAIRNYGMDRAIRSKFDEQYHRSLAKSLWTGSYAASNPDEFFAELSMWYFGTHGDLHMSSAKPENGPAGLQKYDPEAYRLFDNFYSGTLTVTLKKQAEWTQQ